MAPDTLRLGLIGAGWITPAHLDALDRLGRTRLMGVASARLERAQRTAIPRGARGYDDPSRMLDAEHPDGAAPLEESDAVFAPAPAIFSVK